MRNFAVILTAQVVFAPVSRGVGTLLGTAKEAQQLKGLLQTLEVVEVISDTPQAIRETYPRVKNYVKSLFKSHESTSNRSTSHSTKTKNRNNSNTEKKTQKDG